MERRNTWAITPLAIAFVLLLTLPATSSAQSRPRLKPVPQRRGFESAAAFTSDTHSEWQPLKNQAPSGPNGVQIMIQGTDGSILVQSYDGQTWMKLTPDEKGSYVNGTWTTLGLEPVARLYFASQIMPDGRLFVAGGEYSGPALIPDWSNTGEIYDPLTNKWTIITPYPDQPGCPALNYVSGNTTSGSAKVTGVYPNTAGLFAGEQVFASGIPSGATIVSIASSTEITISAPATKTISANFIGLSAFYQPAGCLGDDPSTLLSSKKILVGDLLNSNTYIYDAASNSWSPSGTKVYADSSDEEGWTRSGEGSIVNYDLFYSITTNGSYAEKYNPATGVWTGISPSDGTAKGTIPQLSSTTLGYELGPSLRLQDGRILEIGATPHTALYNPATNTWAAGPNITGTLNGIASPFGSDDAPGAILPNGHVMFAADSGPSGFTSSGNIAAGSKVITGIPSTAILQVFWSVNGAGIPGGSYIASVDSAHQVTISSAATATTKADAISWGGTFSNPTELFDFDPRTDKVTQVTSALPDPNLPYEGSYPTRMLTLPTGQLLFSDDSAQLWVYTSSGEANWWLRPFITSVSYQGDGQFKLAGFQLDGQSAGAAYGDDDQMDANYPIIHMVDFNGNVFYARSFNWSKIGVGDGTGYETVDFTLNPAITPGDYALIVSGAGISSFPAFIHVSEREVKGEH
jgi:Kelch motif